MIQHYLFTTNHWYVLSDHVIIRTWIDFLLICCSRFTKTSLFNFHYCLKHNLAKYKCISNEGKCIWFETWQYSKSQNTKTISWFILINQDIEHIVQSGPIILSIFLLLIISECYKLALMHICGRLEPYVKNV